MTWPWPVAAYPREYRVLAALPLAVLMLGWFWLANCFSSGAADPLPYVPLLNPLELGLLFALFGIYVWARSAATQWALHKDVVDRATQLTAGILLFAFFTALVNRTAHHWGGVPFELDSLLASMQVQAGLSIVWTLMALSLMIGGHLRRRREVWLIGDADVLFAPLWQQLVPGAAHLRQEQPDLEGRALPHLAAHAHRDQGGRGDRAHGESRFRAQGHARVDAAGRHYRHHRR